MSPWRPAFCCTRCCVGVDPIIVIGAVFVGLCVGSFLNVCILRLPRDQSLVRPRSTCPHCRQPIAWRDNIPVFSWLWLRGKCRWCHKPISIQYPIVEASVGLLWVVALLYYGLTIFVGAIIGTAFYLPLMIWSIRKWRRYELPFGVFLSIGAAITFVFGDAMLSWYIDFLKSR